MNYFNTDPEADRLSSMQASIDGVRDNMVANIEKVLERGERIELLVDKSENLSQQAFRFERSSKGLRSAMFRQRLRMYAAAAGVLVLLCVIIAAMACGGLGFRKCRSGK
jgi:vesicle-associated membrane protein 7